MFDALVSSGTASEEWWKNTFFGYEEIPDYPAQITGEYEMAIGGQPLPRAALLGACTLVNSNRFPVSFSCLTT